MTKSMLIFSAVLIAALGAQPVLAQEGRQFLGETSVDVEVQNGKIVIDEACDADFPVEVLAHSGSPALRRPSR